MAATNLDISVSGTQVVVAVPPSANFEIVLSGGPASSPTLSAEDVIALATIAGIASGAYLALDDPATKSHYPLVGALIGLTFPVSIPAIMITAAVKKIFG